MQQSTLSIQQSTLGLGIDTGGTYTDVVLYDRKAHRVVAQAKSPTTPHDLSLGIDNALAILSPQELARVSLVAVSTTLATNACVEGKGGRAALLLLGYDSRLVDRLCAEYGLDPKALHLLEGRHDQRGEPHSEPDWQAVREWAQEMAQKVDAIGVVEYWGIRNPAYENRAREILTAVTGLPVAAAHTLTNEINSLKRAATTLLNVRLIPIMDDLLHAMRKSLDARSIACPLLIVRGDGGLMSETSARQQPVEMLLSGPAASALGGGWLSKRQDCLIVDVGGTTTDIAVMRGGRVALEAQGATVGSWRTGTQAAQVRTIGLGGDTRITLVQGEVSLDSRRALPLCRLSQFYPNLHEKLRSMYLQEAKRGYSLGEFLLGVHADRAEGWGEQECLLLKALREGPLSIEDAAEAIGTRPYFLQTERLEAAGAILRSALTLTDLWHTTGQMSLFDATASRMGVELLAQRLDLSPKEMQEMALLAAERRMYDLLCEHLLHRTSPKADLGDVLPMAFDQAGSEVSLAIHTSLPLVGIGAPTHLMLPQVAKRLGTLAILPENAQVGGAIGAITGLIAGEAQVLIRPVFEPWGVDGYTCHAQSGMTRHETLEEACDHAKECAIAEAERFAAQMGAHDLSTTLDWQESVGKAKGFESVAFLLEKVVYARAVGHSGVV